MFCEAVGSAALLAWRAAARRMERADIFLLLENEMARREMEIPGRA
jgi:hypothetical protein